MTPKESHKSELKYKTMNLTIIFKRLILAYLLIALFFIIAPFFVSQSLKVSYFNNSVDLITTFDPTILDGKATKGLEIEKSNWAQKIDQGPFKAFPVTGGITFTYGGLKVDKNGSVLDIKDNPIKGLFACGELVGGVFFNGYPGGSGLTSGAVFGRMAGYGSVKEG